VADFFPSSLTGFSLRCLRDFWAPLTFYVYVEPYKHRWVLYNSNYCIFCHAVIGCQVTRKVTVFLQAFVCSCRLIKKVTIYF
jgi:hypothetical protein